MQRTFKLFFFSKYWYHDSKSNKRGEILNYCNYEKILMVSTFVSSFFTFMVNIFLALVLLSIHPSILTLFPPVSLVFFVNKDKFSKSFLLHSVFYKLQLSFRNNYCVVVILLMLLASHSLTFFCWTTAVSLKVFSIFLTTCTNCTLFIAIVGTIYVIIWIFRSLGSLS